MSYLSVELIKEIKETEQAAEEMVKTAIQKSKEVLKEAQAKGNLIVQQAINQEIDISRQSIEKAETDAKKDSEIKLQKNKQECDSIKENALKKIDDAVNMVMERIVKFNGDS